MNARHAPRRILKNPHIKTELPGPKARAMIARDDEGRLALLSARLSVRDVARPGHGSLGRRRQPLPRFRRRHRGLRDRPRASAAWSKAVQEAAGKFLHISSDYWHEEMVGARASASPRSCRSASRRMSFFCQSGTESVEGALKLARYVTSAAALHRLPRQLPRPHHGLAVASPRASTRSRRASRRPCRA